MARKRVSENQVVQSNAAAVPARHKSATLKRVARAVKEVVSVALSSPAPELAPAVTAVSTESFQDAVARLAYSYWEARGYQGGSPEADWLRAEQELREK